MLVVENHTDLQAAYTAIFSYDKYTIDIAATREEALKKLKHNEWDIVMFDMLYRGGINGIDLMETYKSDPTAASAKKHPVFIAIVDDEDQMDKIRELADEVFIMGEFTPGELLEKIQECLQKHREHQSAPAA